MMCDLETGVCGTTEDGEMEIIDFNQSKKKIDLYYVTDPICSHCWALEPVLRRFEQQYSNYVKVHTVMGGLLEKWDGFGDTANGIAKPSDVAGHWREVGEQSRMPIDGTLWYDNPVHSSYPPSLVFKVIQKQDPTLANVFLRRIREALFAFNQNIANASVLINIVNQLNLNGEAIVKKAEQSSGQQLLNEDFELAANLGVRGFPTVILVNEENKGVKVVGARPLQTYVAALKQLLEKEELQPDLQPTLANWLKEEKLLFSKEIEVMYDIEQQDIDAFIKKELSTTRYQMKDVLGEVYLTAE